MLQFFPMVVSLIYLFKHVILNKFEFSHKKDPKFLSGLLIFNLVTLFGNKRLDRALQFNFSYFYPIDKVTNEFPGF
jgi:hypothetical protein